MESVSLNGEKINAENAVAFRPQSGLSFIEQLQKCSNEQCTKTNRPYLVGVNEDVKVALLSRPACKMWNCQACAARNARTWIACIINGCNKLGGEWSFLTLTAHKKMRGTRSIKSLREGWKLFYNRILAQNGKTSENIHYVKVWEQHEDGSFHLHILISVCYGTRWAKDNAAECGLGNQAKWTEVSNAGKVAGYVAKYSLKNAHMSRGGGEWPKGLRRIEKSRKWPNLPKLDAHSEMSWIIKMTRGEQVDSGVRWQSLGFQIIDTVKESVE